MLRFRPIIYTRFWRQRT